MNINKPSLSIITLLLASLCLTVQADTPVAEFTEISPPSISTQEYDPILTMEKWSLIEMVESFVKLDHAINKENQTDCDDSSDMAPGDGHIDKKENSGPAVEMEDIAVEDDQTACDYYELEYEEQPFDYYQQDKPSPEEQVATPPALPLLPVIDTFSLSNKKFDFITTNQVFFDHDKTALTDRSKKVLDDISSYIENTDTITRILIDGHTDIKASKQYNYRLSDRRALAVHDYLSKQGVSTELLHIVGLGEDNPIDESWTRTGRQHNRRVEIYILQHNPQL